MAEVDVVVIGAGLAGLRAATDLVRAGHDVVVLEARDRVGGRVWSHSFDSGQWCERGAEFIDANHTEVLTLAADLGLALTSASAGRDDSKRLLDAGGRSSPFALHHSLRGELDRWQAAMHALASQIEPEDPTTGESAPRLDALRLSEVLGELQLSVVARVAVGREIRTEFMVGPDEVSQLMAAWMALLAHRSGDGREVYRIAGGNDQLAKGLANGLGDRVRLASPVASIDTDTGVVDLLRGGSIRAEHVIATVPLPVLGRIWPGMPRPLSAVGYGIGGKVSISVERRVWRDYGRDGSVMSERAWGQMWDTSEDQPGDGGVLTALLSSHDGAALVALPDTSNRVVDEADRIFPGLKGLAGQRVQTDWTDDPWSLGTYAAFGPGQLLAAWPLMHARHGRMVLAGEHTDWFCGFMEGALRSGARAAAQVVACA